MLRSGTWTTSSLGGAAGRPPRATAPGSAKRATTRKKYRAGALDPAPVPGTQSKPQPLPVTVIAPWHHRCRAPSSPAHRCPAQPDRPRTQAITAANSGITPRPLNAPVTSGRSRPEWRRPSWTNLRTPQPPADPEDQRAAEGEPSWAAGLPRRAGLGRLRSARAHVLRLTFRLGS